MSEAIWKDIPQEIPRDKDYWWLDVNNKAAIGKVLKSGTFSFLESHTEEGFDIHNPVMYAEIEPPKREVYCHGCSKAGGAETPIYHLPPICK